MTTKDLYYAAHRADRECMRNSGRGEIYTYWRNQYQKLAAALNAAAKRLVFNMR